MHVCALTAAATFLCVQRAKKDRIREFSKNLRQINKRVETGKPSKPPRSQPAKEMSSREKVRAVATLMLSISSSLACLLAPLRSPRYDSSVCLF